MTIAARYRDVTSTQTKWRLIVPAQAERRWQKALQTMAALAGVEVWRAGKLAGMLIAVAIRAALKLDLEQRVFALRNMALAALQRGVLALQRVGCGRVLL
jgi:hypothetical protein